MQVAATIEIQESVDHLFRHHAGQMISVLSRIFGLEKLDLIEDAVQDALVTALRKWPFTGMPDNPRAWLIEVSKNRVLDRLRRDKKFKSTDDEIESLEHLLRDLGQGGSVCFSSEIGEDQLQMIFACCHPAIPPDAQVALTLKVVSGFSVSEIARAFLAKDEAIAKMITRAKAKLRTEGIRLEMPPPVELPMRLDSVLKVLYLIFNEGYSASEGSELVRKDLCFEAIRLVEFLAWHTVTSSPKVHALAALFSFQGARLSSRCDHNGELLLLSEQDHSLWDMGMLRSGLEHFRLSAAGDELTDYHLEAEIASLYALAPDYGSTDWRQIIACYETLQSRKFSPVVELNRIIAFGQIDGSEKALEELSILGGEPAMSSFNLYYLTRAHFLSEIGRKAEARLAYETAAKLTHNASVARFIEKRLAEQS